MQAIQPDPLTPMLSARLSSTTVGRFVMDFLCNDKLSEVSRVFRDANRESMVASARTMRNRDVTTTVSLNEAVAGICASMPTPVGRRAHEIRERECQGVGEFQEDDSFRDRVKVLNAFAALHIPIASSSLSHATRVKLPDRLQAVCAQQHLNPSLPQGISACFAALHESQRKEADALGEAAIQLFNETDARYRETALSPMRFFHLEAALLDPRIDARIDDGLQDLWQHSAVSHNLPAGAPTHLIRAWVNDPTNAAALNQCRWGHIWQDIHAVPPEIGKLRGLTDFSAGGLHGLPEEMRELQALNRLHLMQCHFRELPPVIGQLQHLQRLNISGTFHDISLLERLPELRSLHVEAPIRVLPDGVWRRCYEENFLSDNLWDFAEGNERYANQITLRIPAENLTDMPFEAWFKLNVHVPYVHLLKTISTFLLCGDRRDPIAYFSDYSWFTQIFAHLFITFPMTVVAIAVIWIQFALNLPILLANLFLHYAVEPMVFAFRDAFEYPRMVHVPDLQPGEA